MMVLGKTERKGKSEARIHKLLGNLFISCVQVQSTSKVPNKGS